MTTTIIVGGSGGLGQHLAAHCAARGDSGYVRPGDSVVPFGGVAKDIPYHGSTIVTATNAAVSGLTKTPGP